MKFSTKSFSEKWFGVLVPQEVLDGYPNLRKSYYLQKKIAIRYGWVDPSLKFVISHYLGDWQWVKEYTNNFVVYDKKELNVGYNIYDIMKYIVDNYDNLPDSTAFIKANILDRHITKEEFEEALKKEGLVPLCTQNHKVDGNVSYYKDGIYHEKNNSWYFAEYPYKYFRSYPEFAEMMGLPCPDYLPFAPGGCYIVPKKNILKRSKEFYQKLLEFCSWSQINAESHTIERSLYNIWS